MFFSVFTELYSSHHHQFLFVFYLFKAGKTFNANSDIIPLSKTEATQQKHDEKF